MSNLFSKHLHLCFFKLKYPSILSQHHHQHHDNSSPSPPSTPNSTMFHFNTTFTHDYSSSSDSDSDSMELPPPDFASVFASQRFFFSAPGTSNSIIESSDTRQHNNNNNNNTLIPRGGVRVPKYSLNPYVDFLRSMQEMIDSRQVLDVRKDWDYLHELLLCYLALNPTQTHKYIVRAFTDLVVDLLSSSSSSSLLSSSSSSSSSPPLPAVKTTPCRKYKCRRQCSFSGRLVYNNE